MHIILGASGHVGASVAQNLIDRGEPVVIVAHDEEKARRWKHRSASAAVVDLRDIGALRAVFQRGTRLFLLNPPANPESDTESAERATLHAILSAVAGSTIDKIVAASTYGAQAGTNIGDLGVLGELEQALAAQPIPATVVRGAYYFTNWDASLESARDEGVVHTFYPPDLALPMVAPRDLGVLHASLLLEPRSSTGLHHMEGPARYSSNDVAAAFESALHRPVRAVQTPRDAWLPALHAMGFSARAAESFCAMTDLTLKTPFPSRPNKGCTSLQSHISALVEKAAKKAA